MSNDPKIIAGLNNTSGFFFEEACRSILPEKDESGSSRFVALKEEHPFHYTSTITNEIVSGTADFVGLYHDSNAFSIGSILFGIECKRVRNAKTWVFRTEQKNGFTTGYDDPCYYLKLTASGNDVRRFGDRHPWESIVHVSNGIANKGYELRDSGNVANIADEKIYFACRQANRAVNGIYLDKESGLDKFNRSRPNSEFTATYMPLVLTNAKLQKINFEAKDVDALSGTIGDEKVQLEDIGWIYYSTVLEPSDQISVTMNAYGRNPIATTPSKRLVAIVNIDHIDEYLESLDL